MSAAPAEVVRPTGSGTVPDDMTHLFCDCQPSDAKTAKCGKTKDTWTFVGKGVKHTECVVCVDLSRHPCPFCGRSVK